MSTQPEVLIRADELEAIGAESSLARAMAAHSLRLLYAENQRLHEVNAELLEALLLADAMLSGANMDAKAVEKKVRAALAKATGEQP